MDWSHDFRGPEAEASWAQGLGSRESGSGEEEPTILPAPPLAQEDGKWGGTGLPQLSVCHHGVIWLCMGAEFLKCTLPGL